MALRAERTGRYASYLKARRNKSPRLLVARELSSSLFPCGSSSCGETADFAARLSREINSFPLRAFVRARARARLYATAKLRKHERGPRATRLPRVNPPPREVRGPYDRSRFRVPAPPLFASLARPLFFCRGALITD